MGFWEKPIIVILSQAKNCSPKALFKAFSHRLMRNNGISLCDH